MRVLSLFSGCGGLDLGFIEAGFDIVYANDINKNVKETYEKNIGEIEISDITQVDKDALPDCDIISAGIPCQPFSSAGNRKGVNDTRGVLFHEVIKILRKKKPKIVLFENVRGFLSSKTDDGTPMPDVIRAELLSEGYELSYKLLNASDYEVPQNRYRVILVGTRIDFDSPFTFPEPMTDKDKDMLTVGSVINKEVPKDEVQEVWKLSPQSMSLIPHIPAGGSWKAVPYDILPDRLKRIRDNMKKYHSPNFYRRFAKDEVMGTITAASTPENSGIVHPYEDRRYSVREIARFQTFPDSFKFVGESVSEKYKMIGNAVPVKLAYHIAKSLKEQYF